MATVMESSPHRSVSGGRVFARVFATVIHNPVPTIVLAFLVGAVPGLMTTYLMQQVQPALIAQQGLGMGFYALSLLSWILGMIVSALTQAALARSTVAESQGRKASIGECLRAGMAVLLPLIILSVLLAIGVAFGFVLFIVPGIILYCMWSVAIPALVEERQGVFGSFGRSRELTDGAKWKVFGIMLVVLLAYWFLSGAAGYFMITGIDTAKPQLSFQSTSFIVISLVVGTVINLFWGLVQASLYVELREWKDGPGTAQLEQVFS